MERRIADNPSHIASLEGGSWRDQLRQAVRDPDQLIDILDLPDDLREGARLAASLFPLVVPYAFISRMCPGDPQDPLLRQVLPIQAEKESSPPEYQLDPLGEREAMRAPGLLQKYQGRALLITTGVCAVACRYCFRRHYPYGENPSGMAQFESAFRAIEESEDIEEVILSGGDPLMRGDDWLAALVGRLEGFKHLRRLRIHTRLPIVIPDRVDDDLIGWLTNTRLAPTFVVHANHPSEIDESCGAALLRLVKAGVPVLNQSVLLRHINDDEAVLIELSRRLLDVRVMPYYLHQFDPVTGASHFEVSRERGMAIVAEMRRHLPGFGVPRYVQEIAGAAHKLDVEGGRPFGDRQV